jgi:hypothetical protein
MYADIIAIASSYFPHLRTSGLHFVLDVRHTGGKDGVAKLCKYLAHVLAVTRSDEYDWSVTSVSPLRERQNLAVLSLLAKHETAVAIHILEVEKPLMSDPMPFSTITFTSRQSVVDEILIQSDLDFGWDLQFSGWLLESSQRHDCFLGSKHDSAGRFVLPVPLPKLAFSSSPDWDCVQFMSREKDVLEYLLRVLSSFEGEASE